MISEQFPNILTAIIFSAQRIENMIGFRFFIVLKNTDRINIFDMAQLRLPLKHLLFTFFILNAGLNMVISDSATSFNYDKHSKTNPPSFQITSTPSSMQTNLRKLQAFDPSTIALPQLVVVGRSSAIVTGIDNTFRGIVSNPSSSNPPPNSNTNRQVSASSLSPITISGTNFNGFNQTFGGIASDPSNNPSSNTNRNSNTILNQNSNTPQIQSTTTTTAPQTQNSFGEAGSDTTIFTRKTNQIPTQLSQTVGGQIPNPKACAFSISSQKYSTNSFLFSQQLKKQIDDQTDQALPRYQIILIKTIYEEQYTSKVSKKISNPKKTEVPMFEAHTRRGNDSFAFIGKKGQLRIFRVKAPLIEEIEKRYFANQQIVGLKSQDEYIFVATEQQRDSNKYNTKIYVYKINQEGTGLMGINVVSKSGYYIGMEFKSRGLLAVIIESGMKSYSRNWFTLVPEQENTINSFYRCQSCGSIKRNARDIFQINFMTNQVFFEVASYIFCPPISLVSLSQQGAQICLSSLPSEEPTSVDCLHPSKNILSEHWNIPGVIVNSYNFGYIWDSSSNNWIFHAQSLIQRISGVNLHIYRGENQFSLQYEKNVFPTYFGPHDEKITVIEDIVIRILHLSTLEYEQESNQDGILILSNGYGFGRSEDNRHVRVCHFPPTKTSQCYQVNSLFSDMDFHAYLFNPQRDVRNLKIPISVQLSKNSPLIDGFIYLKSEQGFNKMGLIQYPFRANGGQNEAVVYTHEGNPQIRFVYSNDENELYSISENEIQVRKQNLLQSMSRTPLNGEIPTYLSQFIGKIQF